MHAISVYTLPFLLMIILCWGVVKKVSVFDTFLEGAAKGISSAVSILPALVGLLCAVTMLRASGFLDFLSAILAPVLKKTGIPAEVLPLAMLKSVSGSGALALVKDIFETNGPDSFAGKIASVMLGSSETTFYVLTVYFGAVKIKNTRYTVPAALIADLTGIVSAVVLCRFFYGATVP